MARLERAYELRAELDPTWALRPRAQSFQDGRAALQHDDPGGEVLARYVGKEWEIEAFLEIAINLARAVRGLHERKIVHGDLKASHVLTRIETGEVWVFGFAIVEPTGRLGPLDKRCDLHALGATLYELLSGHPPSDATTPLAPWIPEQLAAIVMKLLASAAEDRFQTAAGLECVLRGPTLVGDTEWTVAVVGAGWTLGPQTVPGGVPYTVAVRGALRCWVAIGGGLDVPAVLGSRSTDTLTPLGGMVLAAGDELALGRAVGPYRTLAPAPALPDDVVLRVTNGPHADLLLDPLDRTFSVGTRSDRTALRLEGAHVRRSDGEITTIGVLPGAVQLPTDGQPVVLLGNCQTTGGYPVVAVVCAADLRLAAQLRPGAVVRLVTVSLAAARDLVAQAAD